MLNPEVVSAAKIMLAQGVGYRRVMRELDLKEKATLQLREEVRRESASIPNLDKYTSAAQKTLDRQISEVYERAVRQVSELKKRLPSRFVWRPPVEGPVALAFLADIHKGDVGTDYTSFDRDVDTILNTEGMYVALAGDAIDNHIKHLAAVIASRMQVSDQWLWLERTLERLLPKLVVIVSGNHEAWVTATAGFDEFKRLAQKVGVPYDQDEVTVLAHVGAEPYTITIRHKYRFNSTLNPEHSVRRLWEYGDENFDVGVVCHNHVATVAPFERHRKTRWVVRPGTYQTASRYAKTEGYHGAVAATPGVVLQPDRRSLHGFMDLEWCATALRAARAEWAATRQSASRPRSSGRSASRSASGKSSQGRASRPR